MSAETLGGSLLKEVKEEGLDEFLQPLWNSDPSCIPPPTGLPALDQLLQIFQAPPSSRRSLHRIAPDPSSISLHQHTQQQQQQDALSKEEPTLPVLELTSATACAGKTQLLYKIITLALLPSTHSGIPLGGKASAVILFDLRNTISIPRLRDIMTAHISTCAPSESPHYSAALSGDEIDSLTRAALLHLHVFRPQSSVSLAATVAHLPSYIFAQPYAHFSAPRPIGAIVLADFAAFYWQDRAQASDLPQNHPNPPPAPNSNTNPTYKALIPTLLSLQKSLSCPLILTTSTLSHPSSLNNHLTLRPHPLFPSLRSPFVTAQIVLEHVRVPKFAPGISAQEAREEAKLRAEVVGRGERRGWVNWWGEGGWREEVREGVRAWEREWGGGIGVWVGDGVHVGDRS